MNKTEKADLIFYGAGLSASLAAWMIHRRNPALKIILLDRREHFADSQTWCFHKADLAHNFSQIEPLLTKMWDGYRVAFPKLSRTFTSVYCALKPSDLEAHMRAEFGGNFRLGQTVINSSPTHVELGHGIRLEARVVIEAKGPSLVGPAGYQKFVGLHVKLRQPHGLKIPILMDARVPQLDGFRFLYVLPWTDDELLIEDTRYSSDAQLDDNHFIEQVNDYARNQGWEIEHVKQAEQGVLPIPLVAMENDAAIGMQGGFFHPVTGYSLPDAVRIGERLAALGDFTPATVREVLRTYRAERAGGTKYFLLLNRMMFLAASPKLRYKIFERFYTLSDNLIERFYRGQLNWSDRVRILSGKPPVPMLAAMRAAVARCA